MTFLLYLWIDRPFGVPRWESSLEKVQCFSPSLVSVPLLEANQERIPSSSFWSFLTSSLPLGTFCVHKDLGILGNENQPQHILTLSLNNCGFCLVWSRSSFFGWDFSSVKSQKQPNIMASYQENIVLTGEGSLHFPRNFLCILWD